MAMLERIESEQWWDSLYRPLIEQHGPVKVYVTGLAVLGYPPFWDERVRFSTIETVRKRLIDTYGT